MSIKVTRQSMSPNSQKDLDNYMEAWKIVTTPIKQKTNNISSEKLIDNNGLDWKQLLDKYSYDFDWDSYGKKHWKALELRCQSKKNNYRNEEYECFRITELLKEVFIDRDDAQLNFENLIKRIIEANELALAKTVSDQIIKLTKNEDQKNSFQGIYAKFQTQPIAVNIQKNNDLGNVIPKNLSNRCNLKDYLSFKKVAFIGAISCFIFGVSYAAWKNYLK